MTTGLRTPMKEMNHAARPDCLCPSRVGGNILSEAVLAAAINLTAVQAKAAISPMPAFTACVAQRESHGNPRARNRHSSAEGKYQFLDASWRRGLSYMVRDRLIRFGVPRKHATRIRITLVNRPIAAWPEVMQDIGHAEVLTRGGWFHWRNHDRCDRLAVAS